MPPPLGSVPCRSPGPEGTFARRARRQPSAAATRTTASVQRILLSYSSERSDAQAKVGHSRTCHNRGDRGVVRKMLSLHGGAIRRHGRDTMRSLKGEILVMVALAAAPALAQDGASGTLVGSVVDETGHPRGGVRTSAASHTQIGGARGTRSGADGTFRLVGLSPGAFEVTAAAPRLKTVVHKGVAVGVTAPTSIDVVMEAESGVEEGAVVDRPPVVSTASAALKQVLDEEFVDNLPSDFKLGAESVIANAVPGVVQASLRTARVRGGGTSQTAILVEGFDMVGQRSTLKGMAAIEVSTAGYGAEYATVPGGVINMVTKSGSNRFEL